MALSDLDVAREARDRARIDEALAQAEVHALVGDIEHALEFFSEVEDLGGRLPDMYIELRERWISNEGQALARAGQVRARLLEEFVPGAYRPLEVLDQPEHRARRTGGRPRARLAT